MNLECLHHYPTLKRGEGSFVALLGSEKTCHLKNAPLTRRCAISFLKAETRKQFQRKWKIGHLSGIIKN